MADMVASLGLDDREYREGLARLTGHAKTAGQRIDRDLGSGTNSIGLMGGALTKAGGAIAAIAAGALTLKKIYKEITEDVKLFAQFNDEAAAAMKRQEKSLEMRKALVGEFFAPLMEAKSRASDFLYGLVPTLPNAARNFQDDRHQRLLQEGTDRLDEAGGGVQAQITAAKRAHELIVKDLEAELGAGRLRESQYEELIELERQRYGLVESRLLAESNAASAAATRLRQEQDAQRRLQQEQERIQHAREAARLRDEGVRLARFRDDSSFGVSVEEEQTRIQIKRLEGKTREAALDQQRLDTARRIREIEQDEGLNRTQKYLATKRATEQGEALLRAIGARIDADREGSSYARGLARATIGAGQDRPGMSERVFGGGGSSMSSTPREQLREIQRSTKVLGSIESIVSQMLRAVQGGGLASRFA